VRIRADWHEARLNSGGVDLRPVGEAVEKSWQQPVKVIHLTGEYGQSLAPVTRANRALGKLVETSFVFG
jgi:hypothetical protein